MEDVRWLGFDWEDRALLRLRLLRPALRLGHAADQGRQGVRLRSDRRADPRIPRHASPSPGKESPYRNRSVEENLDLFERMKAGEFPDGSRTLRAKIDMASPNLNMRDPVMYRILHAEHHRTGEQVVHLSDVRLRARPVGLDREASPIPSARWSSKTTGRSTTGIVEQLGIYPSAADRVRPPQPDLYAAEQAQAADAGAGRTRARLGRSAHADALRHPAARLHAGGDPQFLRARSASRRRNGTIELRLAGALPARRSEQSARCA